MCERYLPTPAGRFTTCANCKEEPRLYLRHGRTARETMRRDIPATRYTLQCPCGRSTGLHATKDDAEADWGERNSQRPLALPAPSLASAPAVVPLRRGRSKRGAAHG